MHFASLAGEVKAGPVPNQDRFVGAELDLPGRMWKFAMVLDGHGTRTATVDFALAELPRTVEVGLRASPTLGNDTVAGVLSRAIIELDERIKHEFLALLQVPSDTVDFDAVSKLQDKSGNPLDEVLRCASGSTVCIALVDPSGGVHVANLGDCDSFLCWRTEAGWEVQDMAPHHPVDNPAEAARIRSEHPDEPDCVTTDEHLLTSPGIILSRAHRRRAYARVRAVPSEHEQNTAVHVERAEIFHATGKPAAAHDCFLVLASDGLDEFVDQAGGEPLVPGSMVRIAAAVQRAYASGGNMAEAVIWEAFSQEGNHLYGRAASGTWGRRRDDITAAVVPI
ncbi:phosphatase 2C-like domain-containing protein [Mycena amicta]|nr:phosphatase 2C-like domain-containing protein [Mycena amicta]